MVAVVVVVKEKVVMEAMASGYNGNNGEGGSGSEGKSESNGGDGWPWQQWKRKSWRLAMTNSDKGNGERESSGGGDIKGGDRGG